MIQFNHATFLTHKLYLGSIDGFVSSSTKPLDRRFRIMRPSLDPRGTRKAAKRAPESISCFFRDFVRALFRPRCPRPKPSLFFSLVCHVFACCFFSCFFFFARPAGGSRRRGGCGGRRQGQPGAREAGPAKRGSWSRGRPRAAPDEVGLFSACSFSSALCPRLQACGAFFDSSKRDPRLGCCRHPSI